MLWKRRAEREGAGTISTYLSSATPAETEPAFLARAPAVRSSLGPDTVVSGRLSFTVPTRIDGTLRGEVRATDMLVVGETGFIDGTIRAASLVVLGQVRGNVVGAERVEIGPHGTLHGAIETRALVVQEGGQLDGDCHIAPTRATVHLLHPKAAAEPRAPASADAVMPGVPD